MVLTLCVAVSCLMLALLPTVALFPRARVIIFDCTFFCEQRNRLFYKYSHVYLMCFYSGLSPAFIWSI